MENWEYVIDDLFWCENLYTYYIAGVKMICDDDEEPDFPNFQWVAWFLANEMSRVVDYGYVFETALKNISKRLNDDIDYNPSIERQKSIGRILKKTTIKALEKAEEVAEKYNIPFNIDYHERKRLINDKFYKRVKV